MLLRGGWGCGSIKLWARGLKPLYSLVSGEELAGLSNILELSPLLSKTAWIANVVVGLRGVLGEVVEEGVVGGALVGADDILSRFTFCRHLPHRFQMGVGLGVVRRGVGDCAGKQAGSRGGGVEVGEEMVERVEGEVVGE